MATSRRRGGESREKGRGMLSSGHDVTVTLMNSQKLRLHAKHKPMQDQANQNLNIKGGKGPGLTEELLAVDGY